MERQPWAVPAVRALILVVGLVLELELLAGLEVEEVAESVILVQLVLVELVVVQPEELEIIMV
jgi:hypothetical protein